MQVKFSGSTDSILDFTFKLSLFRCLTKLRVRERKAFQFPKAKFPKAKFCKPDGLKFTKMNINMGILQEHIPRFLHNRQVKNNSI